MESSRPSPVFPWEIIYMILSHAQTITPSTGTLSNRREANLHSLTLTCLTFHQTLNPLLYTRIHLKTPTSLSLLLNTLSSNPSLATHLTHLYISFPLHLTSLPPRPTNPWSSPQTWETALSTLKRLTALLSRKYPTNPHRFSNHHLFEMGSRIFSSFEPREDHCAQAEMWYDASYLTACLVGMLFLFAPNLREIHPDLSDSGVSHDFDYNLRSMLTSFSTADGGRLGTRIRAVRVKGYRVDRGIAAAGAGRAKLRFKYLDGMFRLLNVEE
ncbi:hypothetical protein QBC44DRAFT_362895 [Cladorrhinum sp. PSN332]|nr:hypothetical protein QBC44DRAFT_362895 [Cladorrhinum sp. PSN332]